ncbi:MAG: membrane protein insertase YidC [Rickettsiales bacterium]|nr:membrane protein insertase YidC [Rickettsiales bacterium]
MQNNKNILFATLISMAILLGWTWFYEKPRIEQKEVARQIFAEQQQLELAKAAASGKVAEPVKAKASDVSSPKVPEGKTAILALKNRKEILASTKNERIKIESENLHGSLLLKGARFDDLTLAKYFKENDKKEEVVLFAPSDSKERYFTDFGWISSDTALDMPKPDSLWKASSAQLTPEHPVTLSWKNKQNVEFFIDIALDKNFMFDVKQRVLNHSSKEITLASYGRINRVLNLVQKPVYILHEGPIGVFDGVLQEVSYKTMAEDGAKNFTSKTGGWLGITDKYWLSSIIPDKSLSYKADFSYAMNNQNQIFNSEFISQEFKVERGGELKFNHHFFAGAKQVKLLDQYAKDYDIKLFDRAIDFGWFYFLTKPFFSALAFLNKFLGNFGLAILAMTIIIKLILFPMANKSYGAIARMKKLQPKIQEIRANFKGDKIAMNREVMEMYKREKINPASGCLPILIQIPIFFSLYKVIYVTLDMRHAPFYGWIQDLSAPDPTSLFNLFGMLPFEVSGILAIGAWPIIMGLTMVLQQKISPQATDPTQAKVLKFMPYILTFVLAAFPAGLVIYWAWNNLLSIAQQAWIMKRMDMADKK